MRIKTLKEVQLSIISVYDYSENYLDEYDKKYNMDSGEGVSETMKSKQFITIQDDRNGKIYATRIIYGKNGDYIDILNHRYYLKDGEAPTLYDRACEKCGEVVASYELDGIDGICDTCFDEYIKNLTSENI